MATGKGAATARTKPTAAPAPERAREDDILLDVEDLHLHFDTYVGTVKALDGVNLRIRRNETLGLVGESGCGKSVTAMSILRLLPSARYPKGRIRLFGGDSSVASKDGVDLLALPLRQMEYVRGNDVSMIFQEPMTSLNPVMRVGDQIAEAVLQHQTLGLDPPTSIERALEARKWRLTPKLRERRRRARQLAIDMVRRIGIPDPDEVVDRYPHELSGGMRQRIMIAMALACRPALLVADEPTTALDVTIQAQIMELMKELKREEEASILLITHHLGVVAEMCDRVAVMYAGQVVENANVHDVFHAPAHPYTVGLLKSIPDITAKGGDLPVIPGRVPDLIAPPGGCRFHPRCPWAQPICSKEKPPMLRIGEDHEVACHLYDGAHEIPPELRMAGTRRNGDGGAPP